MTKPISDQILNVYTNWLDQQDKDVIATLDYKELVEWFSKELAAYVKLAYEQ
jgi:hypothetical protein